MDDQKLKQLIADSIEQIKAEEREHIALAQAQQIEFDRLMAEATSRALALVTDIPPALLPYCSAAQGPGSWDRDVDIEQLKKGWTPNIFLVDAPGLAQISFRTTRDHHATDSIAFTGSCGTMNHWPAAIAKVARIFQEQQESAQADQQIDQLLYRITTRTPTTGERLESLIREIAHEERE